MRAIADDTPTTSGYGRGMVLLALANATYIVTAYVVTTITARLLDPTDFGSFGLLMAWMTVLTALLVKGLSVVIAREMASGDAATSWQAGRSLGVRLSVALAAGGALLSPVVARAFGAPDLVAWFAVAALAALTFGTNAVLLAWPTGRRDYGRQAIAQVAYAVARVSLVVGGAWAAGLEGALVGYVLAPLVSAASLLARWPRARPIAQARRRMARGIVPVSLVSIAVSAYFVIDIFALSAVLGGGHPQLGIYVAYGTVAHVPFFLLQAASVVAVPALAGSAIGAARRGAIRTTMTDALVLLAGPTLLLAAAGDAAARVIFGQGYEAAGIVLPLALATGAVTLIANLVAVDVAIGRLRSSLAIALAGVALVGWLSVRQLGLVSEEVAARNLAEAVLLGCTITLLVQAAHVRLRHGALLEPRRAAAGIVIAALAAAASLLVEDDFLRTLAAAVLGVAWLTLVLKLRLVDVRRSGVPTSAVPDAEHP